MDALEFLRAAHEAFPPPEFTRNTIGHGNLHRGILMAQVWVTSKRCASFYLTPEVQKLPMGQIIQHLKQEAAAQASH